MNTSKYNFRFDMSYSQAFETIINCCEDIGLVKSQNYADGLIVAKWNTIGHAGMASVVVCECVFYIVEKDYICYVTAVMSGSNDIASQCIIFNRAKRYLLKNERIEFIKENNNSYFDVKKEQHRAYQEKQDAKIAYHEQKQYERFEEYMNNRSKSDMAETTASFFAVIAMILFMPFMIILKAAGIDTKPPKMPKPSKRYLWREVDHSYHFDEDPDMHEIDEDGYCYECDEYEEDMR